MGTHPIFESDFDCLTENVPKSGRAVGGKASRPWPEAQLVAAGGDQGERAYHCHRTAHSHTAEKGTARRHNAAAAKKEKVRAGRVAKHEECEGNGVKTPWRGD